MLVSVFNVYLYGSIINSGQFALNAWPGWMSKRFLFISLLITGKELGEEGASVLQWAMTSWEGVIYCFPQWLLYMNCLSWIFTFSNGLKLRNIDRPQKMNVFKYQEKAFFRNWLFLGIVLIGMASLYLKLGQLSASCMGFPKDSLSKILVPTLCKY